MQGLELSRRFFEECALPVLENDFADLMPYTACGLFGSGSECFGFDDEVSRDHDFEPGFCIMIPGEEVISRQDAFRLERAYAKLPGEFRGFKRQKMAPVGGLRHGVIRISEFLMEKTGDPEGELSLYQWLSVPEQSLAECTNGELFMDPYGEMTRVRERLAYFPEDIRKKKIAGHLLGMAQAGQYNYLRCLKHGEEAAAQLAVYEFVTHASAVIFLLNRVYMPYYKWCFRAMRRLPKLALLPELFEYLITTDNSAELSGDKYDTVEGIAADIIDVLMEQDLTKAVCGDLEKHAYSVNDGIADAELRNMHILAAV